MKTFYRNITVIADKKYSRSYGSAEAVNYPLGYVENGWLHVMDNIGGYHKKMNMSAKHFRNFVGTQIKEATFKRHIAEMRKAYNVALNACKAAEAVAAAQKAEELAEIKAKFIARIKEKEADGTLSDWIETNGNAQQRRIQWSNRVYHLLGIRDNSLGTLLRDTVAEYIGGDRAF